MRTQVTTRQSHELCIDLTAEEVAVLVLEIRQVLNSSYPGDLPGLKDLKRGLSTFPPRDGS